MSEDNIFLEGVFYIALNGQDFLYVTIQYPKERDYAEVKKS